MDNKIVELKDIVKTYDGKKRVLDKLKLTVMAGEIVAIRGDSGSGKSTLMNIIGLLDNYDSGEYYFNEVLIRNKSKMQTKVRSNDIGFIFQAYNLIESNTVWDNIVMPFLYSAKMIDNKQVKYIEGLMEEFRIIDLKYKQSSLLSGGEKQRVAIVRALSKNPKLLIADEPTGNLDNKNAKIINDRFRELSKEGTSVIVVTHSSEIFNDVDNTYYLENGSLKKV